MASSPSGDPHDREIGGDADVVRQLPQRAKRKPKLSSLARIEVRVMVARMGWTRECLRVGSEGMGNGRLLSRVASLSSPLPLPTLIVVIASITVTSTPPHKHCATTFEFTQLCVGRAVSNPTPQQPSTLTPQHPNTPTMDVSVGRAVSKLPHRRLLMNR